MVQVQDLGHRIHPWCVVGRHESGDWSRMVHAPRDHLLASSQHAYEGQEPPHCEVGEALKPLSLEGNALGFFPG